MEDEQLNLWTASCLKDLASEELVWNSRFNTCKRIIQWTVRQLVDYFKLSL